MWWKKKKPVSREDAKAQALANARRARAAIGEDNLQRLNTLLSEKMAQEKSAGAKARDEIRSMDKGHVADHLRRVIDDDK